MPKLTHPLWLIGIGAVGLGVALLSPGGRLGALDALHEAMTRTSFTLLVVGVVWAGLCLMLWAKRRMG